MIHGKASLTVESVESVEGSTKPSIPPGEPVKPRKGGQRMKDKEFWLLVATVALAVADIYAAFHSLALAGGVGLLVWLVFMLQQHQLRRQERIASEIAMRLDNLTGILAGEIRRSADVLYAISHKLDAITSQDATRAAISMARNESRRSKG